MTLHLSVKKIVKHALLEYGFNCSSKNWFYETEDVILIFNFSKSDHDNQHYMNIGFWLKALGPYDEQAYYQTHMNFSCDSLFKDSRNFLLRILSLNISISEEEKTKLLHFFKFELFPFFEKCKKLENLKKVFIEMNLNSRGLVLHQAKTLLSVVT
jgi:hypothetical protein